MKFPKSRKIVRRKVFKRRTVKPKVSLAVKTYVNKSIARNVENKSIQINFGQGFGNILESPDLNCYPMCPLSSYWTISQGVLQNCRIGNIIKPKKIHLNYILRPNPWDSVSNTLVRPMYVQMFLGYVKNSPTYPPLAADFNSFYQSGSSSVSPFGNLRDVIAIVNTDYWAIKKRWTHKIGYANNAGYSGSVATQQGAQYYANNDFKMSVTKRIDITKMLPSVYTFNDSSATANNRNLFFFYNAVAADGSTLAASQVPAYIDYWIDFQYEDA